MRFIIAIALFLALQSRAELPEAFRKEPSVPSRILPRFERPAQEGLRGLEDAVASIPHGLVTFLSGIALQSTLMEGADLKARDKLTESFFRSSSVQWTDQIFFRKFFEHFPVRYRGTNLFVKKANGTYFEANQILLDLERRLAMKEEARGAIATNSVTYLVHVTAKGCRIFNRGQWEFLQSDEVSMGTFEISVTLLKTKVERMLGDVPPYTILKTPDLAAFSARALPMPPLEDKFQKLRLIQRKPAKQKVEILSRFAGKGDAEAEFLLGILTEKGEGVPRDLSSAIAHFERAAKRNYPPALVRLAECYLYGYGVERDAFKAGKLLVTALEMGDFAALALVGKSFLANEGDVAEGLRYLNHAADMGEPLALTALAERSFMNGENEVALDLLAPPLLSLYPPAALARGKYHLKEGAHPEAFKWLLLSVTSDESPEVQAVKEAAFPMLLKLKNELSEDELKQGFDLVAAELKRPEQKQ